MADHELGKTLHSLSVAGEGKQLVVATGEQLDGFTPQNNDCHGNADSWVGLHPQDRAVRGFIAFSDYLFNKHSVVDTGAGLLDITPRPGNESQNALRFIVLDGGSRAKFDKWPNQVIYVPGLSSTGD